MCDAASMLVDATACVDLTEEAFAVDLEEPAMAAAVKAATAISVGVEISKSRLFRSLKRTEAPHGAPGGEEGHWFYTSGRRSSASSSAKEMTSRYPLAWRSVQAMETSFVALGCSERPRASMRRVSKLASKSASTAPLT